MSDDLTCEMLKTATPGYHQLVDFAVHGLDIQDPRNPNKRITIPGNKNLCDKPAAAIADATFSKG
ncbi:hypothetical protein FACS1894166_10140 [Bacilli bacterium]|nr:hypothetical protein FACS1894166_10140 [Bacilli bacterium]